MQDFDVEFVIPDAFIPMMEENGLDAEVLCNMELWTEIINDHAIDSDTAMYTVLIKGFQMPGGEVIEEPTEVISGEVILDDVLDNFPTDGVNVKFTLFGRKV